MCYACICEQKKLFCVNSCRSCCSSYLELEKEKVTPLFKEILIWSGKSILEQQSSIHLLSSLSSRFSSCADFLVDMDSEIRENMNGALDTCQEQPKNSILHSEELVSSDSLKDIDKSFDGIGQVTLTENTSGSLMLERHKEHTLEEVRSIIDGDESDEAENAIHISDASFLSTTETDPLIWIPPAPADVEEDMDSVANNDDDDEYSDGTKWGQSSCLSGFDAERGINFKEERQKVMMEAMNGQFKILVSRFLASEDISFCEGGNGEKWLDIIASLSWEAALLIKPEANEGRAMDPGAYIKVKCVASGDRSQSEVIRGLVFKKNTAHKHMPTKCKNPRLLLLQGVLGHREGCLSSFNSMEQENDYLKSIHEMIDACHPNVVLVEKSVSRDIQEFILKKGMTLVFDMKLARLNRIARCIGSPIISCADILTSPKVKHCDIFHIEKFIEEHNASSEGGKRSSKTLMFLEGFPKPFGCTILLKGAPIVELKKVKHVLQYTVFAAYHLILETSFFVDQRALFSDMNAKGNGSLKDETVPATCSDDALDVNNACNIQGDPVGLSQASASNVPSANGSLENSIHESMYSDSNLKSNGFGPYIDSNGNNHRDLVNDKLGDIPWQFMSSFSSSLKKFLSDSFTPLNSESMSSYFNFKEEELDGENVGSLSVSPSPEAHENETEANDEISNSEKAEPLSSLNEIVWSDNSNISSKLEMQNKDNIENMLDPQSILVLLSSQCIAKGVVCEQSHLSRIKYYGNFDVTLGCYLRDTLLNHKYCCASCGEPPEAHVYCYTHQNGNLTVIVRQLPQESTLSGEAEGRIWMWTRCLKCEHESGIPRSTERVVMSNAARSLSFGKFLELSFSSHSVASRLSSKCGHSLHRDCLRFFGLGSKVAMFRYSPVEIYAAYKPPPVMNFCNTNGQEWIKREAKSVLQKGDLLFLEVANFLQKLKQGDFGLLQKQSKNFPGSIKDVCEVEEMLIQEKSKFEASLLKAINVGGQLGKAVNEILSLSWLNLELILEVYIWDCRLHSLLQCIKDINASRDEIQQQYIHDNAKPCDEYMERNKENCDVDLESSVHESQKLGSLDLELKMESAEIPENDMTSQIADLHDSIANVQSEVSSPILTNGGYQEEYLSSSDRIQANHTSEDSHNSMSRDPNQWIWAPFLDIQRTYRKDLHGGSLQKYEYIHSYIPKYLSPIQLTAHEKELLHFPIGVDGSVISVREDDISSIISCALALYEDRHTLMENTEVEADKSFDNSRSLTSEGSVSSSSFWSSTDSSEGIPPSRSVSSLSSDESSTSSSESSFFVDKLIASENLHPEIHIGGGKSGARNKCSVFLVHAKQFYAIRRMCCPSELAYISSLSRSKRWDAQGGKSKAFFAKTMDDRFIIKQVNKTEIESFLKFAPDYFRHISYSISSGSQTCLAKILGIYQVRRSRGGKEVKTDLMVMENLLFGRNFTRTYDLKGAVFSRYISDSNEPEKVLLDQNFVEDMRISPMYIAGRNKHLFQRAIWNDTSFLTSINVMDYSLLVGVDKQRHELVFGIIDYLRQYTWDKQLETWVKSSLVVPKNSLPTIISPKEYKKRFRKFMSKYFLTVPDAWRSEQCSNHCKFCNDGVRSSSIESCRSSQSMTVSNI